MATSTIATSTGSTTGRRCGAVLGFGLALFLLAWPLLSAYQVLQHKQEEISKLAEDFGPMINAMGGDINNLASPSSFHWSRSPTAPSN